MSKTRSIYFRDDVFARAAELCVDRGVNLNRLVRDLIMGGSSSQLDRIEGKLDLLIPKGMPEGLKEGRNIEVKGEASLIDDEIEKANERLMKKRKIAGAIKTAADIPGHFKPQPKEKWSKK